MLHGWTAADIPLLGGRLAIVTGATSGVGFETALALACKGADVVVAGRNETEGLEALGRIRPVAPASLVRFEKLDLADLASVADFAERIASRGRPVDLLVNNAGVMALPRRRVTADGFEMQLGTNYLGHFALTARLMPLLQRGMDPRVVQVSGLTHRMGTIHFDDLQLERGYTPLKAYSQSKLAMLMFALELERRSANGGWGLMSMAAHPGYARTEMFAKGAGRKSLIFKFHRVFGTWLGHPASAGALPILYAATAQKARPGQYYGPTGAFELLGPLGVALVGKKAQDLNGAARLWKASEELTGVEWPTLNAPTPSARFRWLASSL